MICELIEESYNYHIKYSNRNYSDMNYSDQKILEEAFFDNIKTGLNKISNGVSTTANKISNGVSTTANKISNGVSTTANKISNGVSTIKEKINPFKHEEIEFDPSRRNFLKKLGRGAAAAGITAAVAPGMLKSQAIDSLSKFGEDVGNKYNPLKPFKNGLQTIEGQKNSISPSPFDPKLYGNFYFHSAKQILHAKNLFGTIKEIRDYKKDIDKSDYDAFTKRFIFNRIDKPFRKVDDVLNYAGVFNPSVKNRKFLPIDNIDTIKKVPVIGDVFGKDIDAYKNFNTKTRSLFDTIHQFRVPLNQMRQVIQNEKNKNIINYE